MSELHEILAGYSFGEITFSCSCGFYSRGQATWEEAGAEMDTHLADISNLDADGECNE